MSLNQPIWHTRRWVAYSKVAGSVDQHRTLMLFLLGALVVSNIALGLTGANFLFVKLSAATAVVTLAAVLQGRFIAVGLPLAALVCVLLGVAYLAVLPFGLFGGLVEIALALALAVALAIVLIRYGV